jgi:membrane protein YqaA with SNARE-associated domain
LLEVYLSLFTSSFLAATLIPAQSEAVLIGSILLIPDAVFRLVAVASVGNILGALVNWVMGRFFSDRCQRFFDSESASVQRAVRYYQRWGWVSLFASWVPIIGDPITFISGVMKEPLWRFVLIVTFAKVMRYLILGFLTVSSL